jgi:cell division protein FtsQ
MTVMEPKLAERRKGVSEDRARGRLKWVLLFLVLVGAVVAGIWLIRSPVLSIREVSVAGAERSDPGAIIAGIGMGSGTPTIDVDQAAILQAVLSDPWVASADVQVSFPGSISVEVVEHVPFATVMAADGIVTVSAAGAVVPADPPAGAPRIAIDTGPVTSGYNIANPLILGALRFVAALPPDLAATAEVVTDGEGLTATVAGHRVLLGRPADMNEKAIVLASLIDSGLEVGAEVNVIAPLRPAVTNPQLQLEAEE